MLVGTNLAKNSIRLSERLPYFRLWVPLSMPSLILATWKIITRVNWSSLQFTQIFAAFSVRSFSIKLSASRRSRLSRGIFHHTLVQCNAALSSSWPRNCGCLDQLGNTQTGVLWTNFRRYTHTPNSNQNCQEKPPKRYEDTIPS